MSKPVGSMVISLDLDPSAYTASEKKILAGSKEAIGSIDANWKKLGGKCDAYYDAMRQSFFNSHQLIINKAGTTTDTIVRSYQLMTAKIEELNQQQYAHKYKTLEAEKMAAQQTAQARLATIERENNATAQYWLARMKFEKDALAQSVLEQKKAAEAVIALREKENLANQQYWLAKMAYDKKAAAESVAAQTSAQASVRSMGLMQIAAIKEDADRTKAIQDKAKEAQLANYTTLGIRSTATINEQIANVQRAATTQQGLVQKGSQDWINIERAKNDKLKELNKEMVGGHEMSMASMTRAVLRFYAAWYVASAAAQAIGSFLISGVEAIDDMKVATIGVAAQITTMQGTTGNVTENYRNNLKYAEALVPVLQQVDANSFANLNQIQKMNMAMSMQGVLLDVNKSKQVESFTALSNAVALFTQGQDKEKQASQEIRALFTGQIREGNMVALQMDQQIRRLGEYKNGLKGLLDYAKERNINPLELMKPYLIGIVEASGDIQKTWAAVSSSMETSWNIIQRGLFADFYKSLTKTGSEANAWLKKNADDIVESINNITSGLKYASEAALLFLGMTVGLQAVTAAWTALSAAWAAGTVVITLQLAALAAWEFVVTGSLLKSVSTLGGAMKATAGVFAAFFVGWEIGGWLNNFEIIRKGGVNAVYGIIAAWEWFLHTAEKGWLKLKSWMPFTDKEQIKKDLAAANSEYDKWWIEFNKKWDAQLKDQEAGSKKKGTVTPAMPDVPTVINNDAAIIASAKAKYDALKIIDKEYFKEQEILLKSATLAMKAANATEIDIAQMVAERKLELANEYYARHSAQIAVEEKARSEEDRSKLSAAEFTSQKLLGLDAEVHEKMLAAEQSLVDAKIKVEEKWVDARQNIGMTATQIAIRELDKEMKAYEQLGKSKTEIDELWASKKRMIDSELANRTIGIFKELYKAEEENGNDIFNHGSNRMLALTDSAIEAYGKILDASEASDREAALTNANYEQYRQRKLEQFVNDFTGGMKKMSSATETFADRATDSIDKIAGSVDKLGKSMSGFSSGLSTNQQFGMTWDTYIGFLTPEVVKRLNDNQRAIEWAKKAPEREAAAKEAADKAEKVAEETKKIADEYQREYEARVDMFNSLKESLDSYVQEKARKSWGQAEYQAEFLRLSDSFNASPYFDEQIEILKEMLDVQKELDSIAQQQLEQQKATAASLKESNQSVSDWLINLSQGELAPVQSASGYASRFEEMRVAAKSDPTKTADFLSYAQKYLEFEKNYGTVGSYADVYKSVTEGVQSLGTWQELLANMGNLGLGQTASDLDKVAKAFLDLGVSLPDLKLAAEGASASIGTSTATTGTLNSSMDILKGAASTASGANGLGLLLTALGITLPEAAGNATRNTSDLIGTLQGTENPFANVATAINGMMTGLDTGFSSLDTFFGKLAENLGLTYTSASAETATGYLASKYSAALIPVQYTFANSGDDAWWVANYGGQRLDTVTIPKNLGVNYASEYGMIYANRYKPEGPYMYNIGGLYEGGLTSGLTYAGEGGPTKPEYVVPTYEPQKSKFLKNMGADPETLGAAIGRYLQSSNGGSTGESTIHNHIYIDGKEIRYVVTKGMKTDPDLIASTRRAVN